MSWIITRKQDGTVIGEFFDRRSVDRFDPAKVLVETAEQYLFRINGLAAPTPPAGGAGGEVHNP